MTAHRICVVVDARELGPACQRAWAQLCARVAERTRPTPAAVRPVVVVLLAPVAGYLSDLPRREVSLRVRWWWGAVGPVDTILWAAQIGLDPETAACAHDVVRWDLDLLSEFAGWDEDSTSLTGIIGGLATAKEPPVPAAAGTAPAADQVGGWADGLVEAWDGQIAEHVRAEMARSAGAVPRRVWAGQLARVLPMIEVEARRLAEWYERWLGARVLEQWSGKIASAQIGDLHACISDHWYQANISTPLVRRLLVADLRNARNELAHGRAITPTTAAELRRRAIEDRWSSTF